MTITNILASCARPEPEGYTLDELAEGVRKNGGIASLWANRVIVSPILPMLPIGTPTPSIDLNDIKNRRFGKQ